MRSLLAAILLSAIGPAAQSPPADTGTQRGACVLAGGGKLPPVVFERFLALAGGAGAAIVLVPTASQTADSDTENADTLRLYRERMPGAAITLLHTRDRAVAESEAFCAPLRSATGVWFTGGDQSRLADAYLGTRCEREVMAVLARGGVIGGTSAGTAIQTRVMIAGGRNPPEIATGFDCVPGAISDQHFLKRERLPRLLAALAQHPGLVGIGVDESTAAVVTGDTLDVVGDSKVVLALPAHHGHAALVVDGAPGQTIDLGAWRRRAAERAAWDLAAIAPGAAAGTLLLGNDDAAAERFVALAGAAQAKVVVLRTADPPATDDPLSTIDPPAADDVLMRAGAGEIQEIVLTGPGRFGGAHLDEVFDGAGGAWLQDEVPGAAATLLDRVEAERLRAALVALLDRGGVVWGGSVLGEAIALPPPPLPPRGAETGYCRGLGLLPGTIVTCHPRGDANGDRDHEAPLQWLDRCPPLLRRCAGIETGGSVLVRGGTLEVLGDRPAHLQAAGGDHATPAPRTPLEPGARYDLLTGARR